MFTVFRNAWKIKEIRQRLLYMLFILLIVRLGTHIAVPGIDLSDITAGNNPLGSFQDSVFALITGGSFGTIFSMGIGPYITASIIINLRRLIKKEKKAERK